MPKTSRLPGVLETKWMFLNLLWLWGNTTSLLDEEKMLRDRFSSVRRQHLYGKPELSHASLKQQQRLQHGRLKQFDKKLAIVKIFAHAVLK